MSKDEGGLLSRLKEKAEVGARAVGKAMDDAATGVEDYWASHSGNWKQKIDDAFDEEMFREFYGTVVTYAKDGKVAVKGQLEKLATKYDARLTEMEKTKPKKAGIIDGFYGVYTGNKPNRSRKRAYEQGVGFGENLGWTSAVVLFVTSGALTTIAGLVPAVVRSGPAVDYTKKKAEESKADMAKEKEQRETYK